MTGRDRRLNYEWKRLEELSGHRADVECTPISFNESALPVEYLVRFSIRSICAVEQGTGRPVFADSFLLRITVPEGYPCIDSMPSFRFLVKDDRGRDIPHPWHPNIRYHGEMAGRVCVNMPDTYTDIAWAVNRIAEYLKYELYHALNEAPFPEDQTVASWVIRVGEPNGWVVF